MYEKFFDSIGLMLYIFDGVFTKGGDCKSVQAI